MPKRTFDDFASAITERTTPLSDEDLRALVASTVDVSPDDIDDDVSDFAFSRIMLGLRTGDMRTHLRHLYDVLTVVERELAKG